MPKKTVDKKIFSIDELKPKKHYRIKVKSFDKDKKLIGESPWIIFKTTGKNQAPPNVSNLDADFKGSALIVTWNGSAAREEKDFKEFRIKISSPDHPGIIKNFYSKDDKFNFNEDLNRKVFGSFEGTINVTVYSRDTSDNESSGVSVSAFADVPEDPTNVKLSAAVLGYNVSWDLPTFKNYDYTKIYQSTSESGTYSVVRNERGSSTYVPRNNLSEIWVKVSHVNKAGAESNLVASVPPSITPIDPVPTDVTPPAVPSNLNWEDAGTESINGITTAAMRAHWEVSEITSGYKVRVTEDIVNKDNWAVYDVPASRATVTFKSVSSNVATLTLSAHSFAKDDYVTIFNMGSPFDGKRKITSVTSNTISFSLTTGDIASTAATGNVVISSYTVKELYPGTSYYGAILAYDSANNLTQFVSEGTFATSGTAATVGSKITISGTTMAFGPDVSGTNDGLFINSNNYWYNTGLFNVGTASNSLSWDGVRLRLDGSIVARSGSFSGNVFLAGENLENDTTGSLIATPYLNIQSATWSGGIATIVTNTTPSPAWSAGDIVIISEASKQFDGQYTLLSATDNTFTFSMTGYSSVSSITNVGKMARVNTGDRVIFNSSGIQGWEDDSIAFSFNRNKTSRIGGWTIRPARLFGGAGSSYVGLASTGTWRIWAGNEDPSIAPFRLSGSGNIRAYGLFSSSDVDSGTRISIGSDVSGNKDGIVINDTTNSGIENFWYVPSGVDNGSAYFKVGTSAGSGITVIKTANNTSRVKIKDYDIEGVTSIVDDSKITVNTVEIGKGVGGSGKHGIKVDDYNYWYDPSTTGFPSDGIVFRAGWTGNKSLTVKKNGEVEFEGTTNPTGGTIKGTLTITNTGGTSNMLIGKNVSGTNDGLYFNAQNYWYINGSDGSTFAFRAGGTSRFISFTGGSSGNLSIATDSITISGAPGATQSYADSAAGSAVANFSLVDKWNGSISGVNIQASGIIQSIYQGVAKTYGSATNGWILDNSSTLPRFDIGNSTYYLRWSGTGLNIKGSVDAGTSIPGGSFEDTGGDAGSGLQIGSNKIIVTDGYGGGTISFTNGASPTPAQLGSISPSTASKFSGLEGGNGIILGNAAYPLIEIGKTTANENKILLLTASNVGIELRPNNFVLRGGSDSRITGIPESGTASKYLAKDNGNDLFWADAPTGTGGGTTYESGDNETGIIVNNTSDTITNAGYRMGGSTAAVTADRISTRNRITFGASLPGTVQDGDIHIEF